MSEDGVEGTWTGEPVVLAAETIDEGAETDRRIPVFCLREPRVSLPASRRGQGGQSIQKPKKAANPGSAQTLVPRPGDVRW
jgi:hypothetical protein